MGVAIDERPVLGDNDMDDDTVHTVCNVCYPEDAPYVAFCGFRDDDPGDLVEEDSPNDCVVCESLAANGYTCPGCGGQWP